MEACTVNLYEEIKNALATFDPSESVTQELNEKLGVMDQPMEELRGRKVAGSGLFRKLMGELESIKTCLVKLSMRCSRNISSVYRDRTELNHVEGLIAQAAEDLLKLLKESPAQMLGKVIIKDLVGFKPRDHGSSGSTSTASDSHSEPPLTPVEEVKAVAAVLIASDSVIDAALTSPEARAFYLKHYSSKPLTLTSESLLVNIERDAVEDGQQWTAEHQSKARSLVQGEVLDLPAFNAFYIEYQRQKAGVADSDYILGPNELSYSGGVALKKKNGLGDLVYADGGAYSGSFIADKRSGRGTQTWVDGRKYIGDWKDDEMTGKGVLTYSNGRRYEGEFVKGVMLGKGIYSWPDGRRYLGDFVNDMMDGFGVITSPDGKRYEGEFKTNKKHGRGTHYWPDGARFEGEFRGDLKHGSGVLIEPDGQRLEGEWENDQPRK
mmetsp:Transcript_1189/g.2930  ORF Transcript_1189/g.2930 Transcript_1189/m.2930 type:complete len:436 (-) Transcript_1189:2149-3456(-)